jgi:hypothetical protein
MLDEKFTYNVQLFDKDLKFALVPRNLYGKPYVFENSIRCFNRICSSELDMKRSIF